MKDTRGITLIALIVTIIILLILAGVSLNMIMGENGILKRAAKVADDYAEATQKEQEGLDKLASEIDQYLGNGGNIDQDESSLVVQNIVYKDSLNTLSNPDRGFYKPALVTLDSTGNFQYRDLLTNISEAKASKISLMHLRIDIGQLSKAVNGSEDRNFSQSQLEQLNSMFDDIRYEGMKAIVRFSYDFDGVSGKEPTSFSQIEEHIRQLAPIFQQNQDVISTIEAGIIGIYGEMHSSVYAQTEYFKRLIECYLENTPKTLNINVRTPAQYQAKFGNTIPDVANAHTKADAYRIGIFNDGYLGSESDLGTFDDRNAFINFMQTHGTYTMYGGEVTTVETIDDSYSNIENCSQEMPKTHTTYLNSSFNKKILEDKWTKTNYANQSSEYNGTTAFKYVEDHLGYRLVLRKSSVSKEVKQGEICDVKLSIENVGFANIIQDQNISIILQNGTKCYEAQTNIDGKKIESGKTTPIQIGFYVPDNVDLGTWNIYLKITNKNHTKSHIQLANPDIYSNLHKANYIGKIKITENSNAQTTSFKQAYWEGAPDGIYYETEEVGENGWSQKDLAISDGNSGKIYMRNDDRYLYLRCEDNVISNMTHIHFRIATNETITAPQVENQHDFYIVNKRLYNIDPTTGNALGDSIADIEQTVDKDVGYFEYKIALNTLNISNKSEIKAMYIKLLDASWQVIKEIYGFTK